jgi:hypothetical protein
MLAMCWAITQAQNIRYPINIFWLSAAQYDADAGTPTSFASNPAACSATRGFSCSVYTEKKFMIEGLNMLAFSGMLTRPGGAVGLNVQYFGNPDYNELQAGINYGKSLGKVNIGVGVTYNSMTIAGFDPHSVINVSLATVWQLSENVYSGLQVINPSFLGDKEFRLASVYRLGFGYRHSSKLYTGLEFFKEEEKPPQVLLAVYYSLNARFFTRLGLISEAGQLFAGVGWKLKHLSIEVISSQHAALGMSPAILFTYQKEREN